jgi:hypothetical protein
MSDEDVEGFDFGGGEEDIRRETSQAKRDSGKHRVEEQGDSSWPAKQVHGIRRGGFGRPPTRKHYPRSNNGSFRTQNSSSPEESSNQLPQRRWRTRGTREGRTGQWVAKETSSESPKVPSSRNEDLPDGDGEEDSGVAETDGIIQYGDVEFFLQDLKLGRYISLFRNKKMTFAQLLTITDAQLEEAGVNSAVDRKTILEGIKSVHLKKWDMPQSAVPADVTLSGKELPLVLSHLEAHVAYLKGTVMYVSRHIEDNPVIIDPSLECKDTEELLKNLSNCTHSVEQLSESYKVLKQKVHKATNYQSTDIQRTSLTQRRSLFATFGTATAVAAVGVSVGVFLSWKGFFPSSIFQRLSHLISNKV